MSLLDVAEIVEKAVTARQSSAGKQTEWNGFKAGEMVRVRDESGAKFRFVAYVPAGTEGSSKEFVELFGGRRGKEKMRYIRPDRVMPLKKPTRRRAAAAAPAA